jgi:cyclophilin family peptidyl-prolyl cis-trans isomerase
MANAGANTNGAQFFIITKKDKAGTDWLNGLHTPFGKVIEGLDVAEKIQNVATGQDDKPTKNVIVKRCYIEKRAKK